MNFKKHYNLEGQHALLGASKYHWIGYDDEKLFLYIKNIQAKEYGTRLHAFAHEAIELGVKLPASKKTLNMFVNDAIGYHMESEQILYYSDNFFGTADAISFRKNLLRIHDLKTGEIPAHMEQLEIYAALFCLEYHIKPSDIDIELRIYQNNEKVIYEPSTDIIVPIMDKITHFDKLIDKYGEEERS